MPFGCQLTNSRAVCLHQTCNVVRLVVSSRRCSCCGAVDLVVPTRRCRLCGVDCSVAETAVPSQHLRQVVVVAASVLGVRKAMAVVWSRVAVVPGEASVREREREREEDLTDTLFHPLWALKN